MQDLTGINYEHPPSHVTVLGSTEGLNTNMEGGHVRHNTENTGCYSAAATEDVVVGGGSWTGE